MPVAERLAPLWVWREMLWRCVLGAGVAPRRPVLQVFMPAAERLAPLIEEV